MKNSEKHSEVQAVILAAGTGSRLGHVAKGRPKCLLEVGGRSLLRHHLANLQEIGVEKILIVAGHHADQVGAETEKEKDAALQLNEDYDQTNSLYSLWLAREWVTGGVMLINGDVLAAPPIYRRVLEADGSALAFDSASGCEAEEMKVRFDAGRLDTINKEIEPALSHGENLGILKFDAAGARALLQEADRIVAAGRVNEWAPAAVDGITKEVPIKGVDVSGLPWTEIDFPQDLEHARNMIWPAIDRRSSVSAASARPRCESGSPALIPKFAS